MQHYTGGIVHTIAFLTAVIEHWLEREMALVGDCTLNERA